MLSFFLILVVQASQPSDNDDVFPTAQLVSAMRAVDAQSPKPLIGSNIAGAGPDKAAAFLAGKLGVEFLDAFAAETKITGKIASKFLGLRSMFLDEKLVESYRGGCRQFVILAAGLDVRAWRLDVQLSESATVFELDMPRAIAYKERKLERMEATAGYERRRCKRVVVEADLRDSTWAAKLVSAGFQRDAPSFFLLEGLLMYLPPEAPLPLLRTISSLMSPGSALSGDSFINYGFSRSDGGGSGAARRPSPRVLERYGARWTYDAKSRAELRTMLVEVSLTPEEVVGVPELLYQYRGILGGGGKRKAGSKGKPPLGASGRSEYACFHATKAKAVPSVQKQKGSLKTEI